MDPIIMFNITKDSIYRDLDKCYIYPKAPC
nr:MAG TPA: hypothetical protein [Bacteriophage sp.]